METNDLNLCELLKGHEDETFYSTVCGDCKVKLDLYAERGNPITISTDTFTMGLRKDGKMFAKGETVLFPSKSQRDWNKWAEEQKPRLPKTWQELEGQGKGDKYVIGCRYREMRFTEEGNKPVEKSAMALLKIYQLIENCYGGFMTLQEFKDNRIRIAYTVVPRGNTDICFKISVVTEFTIMEICPHFIFNTWKQANEFISYPENIKLLKDFYMCC